MIPKSATVTLERLDPTTLEPDDSHIDPMEPWMVRHYEQLLVDQPDADTDPILVFVGADGQYRVRRGRHRVQANRNVGRTEMVAMVVRASVQW